MNVSNCRKPAHFTPPLTKKNELSVGEEFRQNDGTGFEADRNGFAQR